jgi:hypothetical protein
MPTIKDLKAREIRRLEKAREQLDLAKEATLAAQAIETMKEIELSAVSADVQRRLDAIDTVVRMNEEAIAEEQTAPYRDMLQDDAIRLVLLKENRRMNSSEIADAMKVGGYVFASGNPPNAVVVAANTNRREYFTTEKEGNRTLVGLKEWVHGQPGNKEDHEEETAA